MFFEMTMFTMFTNRVNCKTSSQWWKMDASQGVAKAVFLLHHAAVDSMHFVSLSLSLSLSHTHTHTHTYIHTYTHTYIHTYTDTRNSKLRTMLADLTSQWKKIRNFIIRVQCMQSSWLWKIVVFWYTTWRRVVWCNVYLRHRPIRCLHQQGKRPTATGKGGPRGSG